MFILISQRLCRTSELRPLPKPTSKFLLPALNLLPDSGKWDKFPVMAPGRSEPPPRLRQFHIIRAALRLPCSPDEHLMELHSFKPNGGIRTLDTIAALILTLATEWSALDMQAHAKHCHDRATDSPPPPRPRPLNHRSFTCHCQYQETIKLFPEANRNGFFCANKALLPH